MAPSSEGTFILENWFENLNRQHNQTDPGMSKVVSLLYKKFSSSASLYYLN